MLCALDRATMTKNSELGGPGRTACGVDPDSAALAQAKDRGPSGWRSSKSCFGTPMDAMEGRRRCAISWEQHALCGCTQHVISGEDALCSAGSSTRYLAQRVCRPFH